MPRFYRAFFRSDDNKSANVNMDLLLGEDRKVPQKVPCFGFWGQLHTRELMPFVYEAGQLDFGDYEDENDRQSTPYDPGTRYGTLDLADRIIAVEEQFVLVYCNERWSLTLQRLTDVTLLEM